MCGSALLFHHIVTFRRGSCLLHLSSRMLIREGAQYHIYLVNAPFAGSRSHFEGIAPCVDACDAVPPFSTKNVTYPRSISRSGTDFRHILALSSKNGAYFQCFLLNMDKKAAIDAWKEPATQQKLKQEPVRLGNASIRDLLH